MKKPRERTLVIRVALCVFLCAPLVVGCGKKGAPLPPFARIPAPVNDLNVTRIDRDVYVRFTVPTVNIDNLGPADIARVELYAFTSEQPVAELQLHDSEDLRKVATLVASRDVRRPLPPLPPDAPAVPPPPLGPGVDQGSVIVLRDELTPEMLTSVVLPDPIERRPPPIVSAISRPPVAPSEVTGPIRYYMVFGVSQRGRYGPPSGLVPAPLAPTSSAPPQPELTFDEKSMTLRWTPAPDARGVVPPTPEGLLPSRPIAPGPPPTTYDIYEVSKNGTPAAPVPPDAPADPAAPRPDLTIPTGLTPAPIGPLELTQEKIVLGAERCFVVRPVDIINGIHVRGPASPMVCAPFTDTFVPNAPSALAAIATGGAINLIWEPSDAADLAGYLVLRGEAAGGTLTPLTPKPLTESRYSDTALTTGVRYIYAVVAVDKAGNRSVESNRVEEIAR